MPTDELLRWIVGGVLIGGAAFGILGGLLTPVGGRWRDGDTVIKLIQVGPFVRGTAEQPGGGQNYKGIAAYGRIKLNRTEWGREYLQSVGFDPEAVPLLAGQVTADLTFSRVGDELVGTVQGRKFNFAFAPPRIVSIKKVPPAERVWRRVT